MDKADANVQADSRDHDLLETSLSYLATDTIAGFDTNAIQSLRDGNSIKPFLLTTNDEYVKLFEALVVESQVNALRSYIRSDLGARFDSARNAVAILALGSVEPERPPYIALCLYGGRDQVMYWMNVENGKIKRVDLPRSVPVIVDSLLSLRPGSVEERGAHGNRIAFISIITPYGHYAMIAAPGVSTSGHDYDQDWDFKLDIPRDAFNRRKVVDALLRVTADVGDPHYWKGVW